MLRNYIKVIWRNLSRNRVSSIINIGGLAIGLACVILIGMYVKDETSYDRSFSDAARIYRVNTHEKVGSDDFSVGQTAPPVGKALANDFPEIQSYTRIFSPGEEVVHFVKDGEQNSITEKHILAVDSNFLEFFDYPIAEGNRSSCLNGPHCIVLTERSARRYFGNASPIGKTLLVDQNSTPFTVTAVLKDPPEQSSLQFEVLESTEAVPAVKRFDWSWVWLQMGTYVKLQPGVASDPAVLRRIQTGIPAMVRVQAASAFSRIGQPMDDFIRKGNQYDITLQRLADVHLYSAKTGSRFVAQGDVMYVYIFSAIALFIILLACVNFMNLATAQSAKRAREVGIRKVLGSGRRELMLQFLGEALVYSILAAAVAILIASIALPAFNSLSGKSLSLSAFFDIFGIGGLLLLVLVTAALAGSYPALYLTSFRPAKVLKGGAGDTNAGGRFLSRNALVVFQFTVSMVLINCTIIVFKQLLFERSKDLGFSRENLLIISGAGRLGNKEASFQQELLRMAGVADATVSTGIPTTNYFDDTYVPQEPADAVTAGDRHADLTSFIVDDKFIPTMQMTLASGRNFSKAFSDSASIIINEETAAALGWKDPVGKHILYPGGHNTRFTVIGVVKDFHFESLHNPIVPFALFYTSSKTYSTGVSYVTVRLRPGDPQSAIHEIGRIWKGFSPDNPFEYSFLDATYDALYRADATVGKVFGVFTLLSLVVACLGLLGLARYTAERRRREVGIRKVLGASVHGIVAMLSREFLRLVGLAALIAIPIAWYAMHKWLQDFAYSTKIDWWIFAVTAFAATLIALLTVSFQSVKAGLSNPVESLRNE